MNRSLQTFLNQFTYSAKMNFVILVGFFCVFFLVGMLILVQEHPIAMKKQKIAGLVLHNQLSSLIDRVSELEMVSLEEVSNEKKILILKELEADLNSYIRIDLTKFYQDDDEILRELVALQSKLFRQWEAYKNENEESLLMMIGSLNRLIDLNAKFYGLLSGFEIEVYLLEDALVARLPRLQRILLQLTNHTMSKVSNEQQALSRQLKDEFIYQISLLKVDDQLSQLSPLLLKRLNEFVSVQDSSPEIVRSHARQALNEIEKSTQGLQKSLKEKLSSNLQKLLFQRNVSIVLIATGCLAILLMYLTKVIRKPLNNLKLAAREIAKGNFSVRVPITSHDEVGEITKHFNQMAEFIENRMLEVKKITAELYQSAFEINDSSSKLETNIVEQLELIHNISSELREISNKTQNFINSFKEVTLQAGQTSRLASLGSAGLVEMDLNIQQMVEASENIVKSLSSLKEYVAKINGVISTIVQIADQSNLLSLNTAIKASKCGYKGSGFAVVADKIRELADQTAFGTLDIEEAIREIIGVVSDSLKEVENFSNRIFTHVADDKKFQEKFKKLILYTQEQVQTFERINQWMESQLWQTVKSHDLIHHMSESTSRSSHSIRVFFQHTEQLFQSVKTLKQTTDQYIYTAAKEE